MYQASAALDNVFLLTKTDSGEQAPFIRPVTRRWRELVTLGPTLIAHASTRGAIAFMRDLMAGSVSLRTVHNIHQPAAQQAISINDGAGLSAIRVGLHDDFFQGLQPALAGVDATSTYRILLAAKVHRVGDTWAIHLLGSKAYGRHPDDTIADADSGLCAGRKIAKPDMPCCSDGATPNASSKHPLLSARIVPVVRV